MSASISTPLGPSSASPSLRLGPSPSSTLLRAILSITRAAPQDGTRIGVSRYVHRGELLIEVALIVSIPKDLPMAEQGEYARKRMDELMGSISISP